MYTRRPRPRPRSPDNPGPPFSARSEGTVPSHWVCTTSANGVQVQGQGAGKATTPGRQDEQQRRRGQARNSPAGSTARSERRSEKDDLEGVCEAASHGRKNSTKEGERGRGRGRKFMEGQAVRVRKFMGRGVGNVGIGKPGAAFFLAPKGRVRRPRAPPFGGSTLVGFAGRQSIASHRTPPHPASPPTPVCCAPEPGPLPLTPPQRRRPRSHTRPRRGTPRSSRARRRGA